MKKIILAFAFIAVAGMFSACVQEQQPDNEFTIGKNDIVLNTGSAVRTKAADGFAASTNIYKLTSEADADGVDLFLQETVTSLYEDSGPATKGTPIYTMNAGEYYGKFSARAYAGTTLKIPDTDFNYVGTKTVDGSERYIWTGQVDSQPWGDNASMRFFMRMPVEALAADAITYDPSAGTFTFAYTSPSKATDQQDLLFASRDITKAEHDALRNTSGVPVLFQHALTAVKFRMGNELSYLNGSIDPSKTRTFITKVEFIGLLNSGTATITPTDEEGDYVDIQNNYSSAASGVVAWNFGTAPTRSTASNPIYQAFGDDDLVDFAGTDKFPASFSADTSSGTDKNLNDEDATMTFWLIPQTLDANVQVKITVRIDPGTGEKGSAKELILNLGELQSGITWKAGELRTYTIKPLVVDVEIDDKVSGNVKSDVVIRNTGNVPMFVRVNIIGNWMGKRVLDASNTLSDETVLMGYTSADVTDMEEVARWGDKEFTMSGSTKVYDKWTSPSGTIYTYTPYGEFVGLPSKSGETVNKWIRLDKYYYYTEPIGPGEELPSTDPLFETYTINTIPDFYIADQAGVRRAAQNVHLVMDLIVQSISTSGYEDNEYQKAWKVALGVTDLNDLP